MTQSSQSMTTQNFNTALGCSSIEIENRSQLLLTSAEAEVRRALMPADSPREDGTGGGSSVTQNQPNFPSIHTQSNKTASAVLNLSPLEVPAPTPHVATLHALQEWEGYVVEIGSDEFVARLVDLTAGLSHESEEATIPLVEISERDVATMVVGSIFRWVIGYERSPEGTRSRKSQIVFRDLPRMTEADLREGERWAGRVARSLNP